VTTLSDGIDTGTAGTQPEGRAATLRSLPAQVRLAMGRRGVLLAAVAVAVGFLCIVATFVDIAASLETAEMAFHRRKASEISLLDQSYRDVMRTLNSRSAGLSATEGTGPPVRRAWAQARASMDAICDSLDRQASNFDTFLGICADSTALRGRFDAEIAAFDPPRRMIDRDVLAEALQLSTRINQASVAATRENDTLVDRMAHDYSRALVVLTLGTIGFTAAGLVLIVLVGRTSMLHHGAWQQSQATEALLQETIDTLPAGVVLYDKDERLVMFNDAAASVSPALRDPEGIGSTYAERAHISERRNLEAGITTTATAEQSIALFRNKGSSLLRRTQDGRWIEWSHKSTRTGGTVGLRVDVTALKNHELQIERARAEYQSLVDSLSDAVYAIDIQGHLTFVSAAAAELFGTPVSDLMGKSLRELIVPEDLDKAIQSARAFLASTDRSVHTIQLRILRASGEVRHVEVRYRKPVIGGNDEVVQVGVIRDVTERVELMDALQQQVEKAEEARALLQETLDALPAGVVLYDSDERVMMFNKVAVSISPGLAQPDVVGRTFSDLARDNARRLEAAGYPPLDVDAAIKRFRKKGAQGQRQTMDGRWIDFSEQVTPSGRTVGLRVDVSEIKNRELEVGRARAEYEALVDSLSDMVVKIDIDSGEFTFASAAAGDLLGVAPEKLLGVDVRAFIHPDDEQAVISLVREERERSGSLVRRTQFRMRRADGAVRHVEVGFRKMPREAGRTLITGVFRDVSESVELARRLAEETGRLRSIVESSGALVLVTDADLRILMVNREFRTFWDLGEEDIIGRSIIATIGTGLTPEIHRSWLSGESTETVNYTRVRRDPQGRQRRLSVTGRPIADENGVVRQIVFLGVDDTERRDAEQALFDSERMATVGEMAATMAHEIAQPLQVINLAAGSAQDELEQAVDAGTPADAEYLMSKLQRIAAQTERASRIISELRSFVRGTSDDQPVAFDAVVAVKGSIDLTRHALAQMKVTLALPAPGGLPPVMGHVERVEQVLVNLINNARDAGAPTIDVTADLVLRGDRRFVRIAIEDTGPGIAADVLPRLFDTFVTTKARGKGTGLGLRICRRIVEEMGGSIAAANRESGGARFEILLPTAEGSA
jgi:PAS domain S-box-containing protein